MREAKAAIALLTFMQDRRISRHLYTYISLGGADGVKVFLFDILVSQQYHVLYITSSTEHCTVCVLHLPAFGKHIASSEAYKMLYWL
jgi:hypothetical protein